MRPDIHWVVGSHLAASQTSQFVRALEEGRDLRNIRSRTEYVDWEFLAYGKSHWSAHWHDPLFPKPETWWYGDGG